MINCHYPARDGQSHTAKKVYTGAYFGQFFGVWVDGGDYWSQGQNDPTSQPFCT